MLNLIDFKLDTVIPISMQIIPIPWKFTGLRSRFLTFLSMGDISVTQTHFVCNFVAISGKSVYKYFMFVFGWIQQFPADVCLSVHFSLSINSKEKRFDIRQYTRY